MIGPRRGLWISLAALVAAWLAAGHVEAREIGLPTSTVLGLGTGLADLSNTVSSASNLKIALRDCRRWQAAAASLGETYAGHRLRQTLRTRQCLSLETERGEAAWEWPWSALHGGRVLPATVHAAQGEWEIRCSHVAGRRRCALLNVSPTPGANLVGHVVVTHFVIDRVAGREALLWRLFAPSEIQVTVGRSPESAGRSHGEVRYRLEDVERAEVFPACSPAGCLMEATSRHAGDVATRLWEGRSIDVSISMMPGGGISLTLPATGFRAGLKELVRLRRDEIAGRN